MPTMAKDNGVWVLPYTVHDGTNNEKITFPLGNKFADGDLMIQFTMPDAIVNNTLNDNTAQALTWADTLTNNYFYPTVTVTGSSTASSSGWLSTSDSNIISQTITVGKVPESLLKNGTTTISSGSTVTPGPSEQTITITEGYNSARTIIVGSASSSNPGAVKSGTATITDLSYAYVSSNSKYTITGSADVSAPTSETAGYISSSVGTRSANTGGATVSASVNAITLSSSLSGATSARKPTLSKQAISITGVVDAASGNAQSTAPTSGVYVAMRSAANTATISSAPSIAAAGYGSGSNFIAGTYGSATVGAAQSDIYYVPITTTTAAVNGGVVSYGSGWITAGSINVGTASIASGAGTAIISDPSYDTTNEVFTLSASGTIAAPTVNTAGYVSSTEGTKTGNSISGSKDLSVVKVGVTVTGTAKVTPDIARTAKPSADTWVDAADGAATTTKPTSGPYIQVNAAAKSSSISSVGKVSAAGYGTTSQYLTDTATSTSVGSNAAANTYVPIKIGSVKSGSATISSLTYTYSSANSNFTIAGSANVSAPSVTTEGYISSTVGTRSANNGAATVSTTVPKIAIQANLSGTGTKAPSITKHSNTNMASAGTATTTKPSSGYYVAVSSAANTGTVQATASVTTAGYGTTTSGQYTTTPSSSLTVGAAASSVTYVPVTAATFANTATSGKTYTDISSTAPVLISGDYLYINEGYTGYSKISLARLVPDASGTNAPAAYIRSGYTAFDNSGALITGTMATYDGTYTVS